VLQLTTLTTIPILIIYEYYIVSKLIIPAVSVQYSSLKAILDHRFEIHGIKSLPGQPSLRNQLRSDFKMSGYDENKLNSTVFEIKDYNALILLSVLNPAKPNRAILIGTPYIDFILDYVENKLFNGSYKCYKIERAAVRHHLVDLLWFRHGNEAKKMVSFIDAGGISQVWKDWVDFYYKLQTSTSKTSQTLIKRIQMDNLISIFFLCADVLIWPLIVFIGEVLYHRKCHRVRIYNYLK
jgi:hypothetical protein